jgi:hypothetical protein
VLSVVSGKPDVGAADSDSEVLMQEHSRPDMSGHVRGSSYGMPGAVDGVSGHIVQHIKTHGCRFLRDWS